MVSLHIPRRASCGLFSSHVAISGTGYYLQDGLPHLHGVGANSYPPNPPPRGRCAHVHSLQQNYIIQPNSIWLNMGAGGEDMGGEEHINGFFFLGLRSTFSTGMNFVKRLTNEPELSA